MRIRSLTDDSVCILFIHVSLLELGYRWKFPLCFCRHRPSSCCTMNPKDKTINWVIFLHTKIVSVPYISLWQTFHLKNTSLNERERKTTKREMLRFNRIYGKCIFILNGSVLRIWHTNWMNVMKATGWKKIEATRKWVNFNYGIRYFYLSFSVCVSLPHFLYAPRHFTTFSLNDATEIHCTLIYDFHLIKNSTNRKKQNCFKCKIRQMRQTNVEKNCWWIKRPTLNDINKKKRQQKQQFNFDSVWWIERA